MFTLVVAAMLLAARSLVQDSATEELAVEAARDQSLLAAAMLPLLASRNLADAGDLLARLVVEKAFVYVEVDDASGRPWAKAGLRPAAGVVHFDGELSLDGRAYGRYRFGLDAEARSGAERRMLAGLMAIGLTGLLAATVLQMLLSQLLTRRLEALTGGVDRLAQGESGVQLPVTGADEVARLAAAFNRMSAALSERLTALQDSEQHQRLLVESLAAGVLFQDAGGIVRLCNDAACQMLGLAREQLLGLSAQSSPLRMLSRDGQVIDPDQRPAARAMRGGQAISDAILHVGRTDGSWIWISVNSQPLVRAGEVVPYASVNSFVDVSRHIEAEDSLEQANLALEQRVAERTAELATARDTAEAANRAKTEFLSRMSHELRTPLNAVLGFTQVLRLRLKPAPAGVDEQLGHIETAGWHLLELINDVLDLSRIESGAMVVSCDSVPLAPLFDECARMLQGAADAAQVTLTVVAPEPGLAIEGDRTRLRQVLVNLLSNACKYNRPGGSVVLSATAANGHVTVAVVDTGIGLTPTQLKALYQPFNRLGAEAGRVEGTGIGLVITKRLVELMGGTLEASSVAGVGTTFHLRARRSARALPSAAATSLPRLPAMAPTGQRSLLYIEDNAANVQLLAEVLRLRPALRLLTAVDGASGLLL
ncbi:MAG: ATP-binding protein, partial [Rubrivivax sp.]|nr:ATP-binding protein [Rubrivivax sp.]